MIMHSRFVLQEATVANHCDVGILCYVCYVRQENQPLRLFLTCQAFMHKPAHMAIVWMLHQIL
jgi:hypothetical protein